MPDTTGEFAVVTGGKAVHNVDEIYIYVYGRKLEYVENGVYRLYNTVNSHHMWTSSYKEANTLYNRKYQGEWEWESEGIGWIQGQDEPTKRYYNPNNGDHIFTLDDEEATTLYSLGWNSEGTDFKNCEGGTPVYRLYNPDTGLHLYTIDKDEIVDLVGKGWVNEGVKVYGKGEKLNTTIYDSSLFLEDKKVGDTLSLILLPLAVSNSAYVLCKDGNLHIYSEFDNMISLLEERLIRIDNTENMSKLKDNRNLAKSVSGFCFGSPSGADVLNRSRYFVNSDAGQYYKTETVNINTEIEQVSISVMKDFKLSLKGYYEGAYYVLERSATFPTLLLRKTGRFVQIQYEFYTKESENYIEDTYAATSLGYVDNSGRHNSYDFSRSRYKKAYCRLLCIYWDGNQIRYERGPEIYVGYLQLYDIHIYYSLLNETYGKIIDSADRPLMYYDPVKDYLFSNSMRYLNREPNICITASSYITSKSDKIFCILDFMYFGEGEYMPPQQNPQQSYDRYIYEINNYVFTEKNKIINAEDNIPDALRTNNVYYWNPNSSYSIIRSLYYTNYNHTKIFIFDDNLAITWQIVSSSSVSASYKPVVFNLMTGEINTNLSELWEGVRRFRIYCYEDNTYIVVAAVGNYEEIRVFKNTISKYESIDSHLKVDPDYYLLCKRFSITGSSTKTYNSNYVQFNFSIYDIENTDSERRVIDLMYKPDSERRPIYPKDLLFHNPQGFAQNYEIIRKVGSYDLAYEDDCETTVLITHDYGLNQNKSDIKYLALVYNKLEPKPYGSYTIRNCKVVKDPETQKIGIEVLADIPVDKNNIINLNELNFNDIID